MSKRPAHRSRRDRRRPAIAAVAAVALIVTAAVVFVRSGSREQTKTAVIVDQLSLTYPNPAFVDTATRLLENAGYEVDYVPGEAATVGLYQQLPTFGHDLVVLRSHSARIEEDGEKLDDVALFTGERIDLTRYAITGVSEPAATAAADAALKAPATHAAMQVTPVLSVLTDDEVRNVKPVFYSPESAELPHFGLLPEFVEQNLDGSFEGQPTVIMMGCDGLRSGRLAQAFLSRGAGGFVSWDQPVSAPHTDAAIESVLRYHLVDDLSIAAAIERTMGDVGPDPHFGSRLVYVAAE